MLPPTRASSRRTGAFRWCRWEETPSASHGTHRRDRCPVPHAACWAWLPSRNSTRTTRNHSTGLTRRYSALLSTATGEGQTLVATLPLYLSALAGKGGHLLPVDGNLAR